MRSVIDWRPVIVATALATAATGAATAQKPPPVRQIGKLERISTDSLASASTVVSLSNGGVFVNDITGRRVVLFDSTLSRLVIVADTTSATANAYTPRPGTLIRYHGDTALLIAPSSLSMLVLGPIGNIVRVMAIPRSNEAQAFGGGNWGTPGFDARGRLIYFNTLGVLPGVTMLRPQEPLGPDGEPISLRQAVIAGFVTASNQKIDSAVIIRADLVTRGVDTAAWIKVPRARRVLKADDQHLLKTIETTPDPLPLVDDWVVMRDGSLAIVRGRDYHVDWLDGNGRWSSSPRMPFDWQRVDDSRKQVLIDSAVADWQKTFDRVAEARRSGGGGAAAGRGAGGSGGRGGGGGGGGGGSDIAPNIAVRPSLNDVPDYFPPFKLGASRADDDGNIWILTTAIVNRRPVYDIVNRRGELFDRVQLPEFRTLAGFGPGVVYMAVKDSTGVVHVERARVK
jgi:hypothetical protein